MTQQARILLLYTGGTIGMVRDPSTGALHPFKFEFLLHQIPELAQLPCVIETDSFERPIDSSDMQPEQWLTLAHRIRADYDRYDGFVILHGSDTMAYTASALSFLLEGLNKPVILTGSQLPIGITRSDARENLITTMEIASARTESGGPRVPEVAVYFEYDLYRGSRVFKNNAEDFEAFQSLNYPKLAEVGVHIKYNEAAIRPYEDTVLSVQDRLGSDLAVLTLYPGITEVAVAAVCNIPGLKVLILQTFGAGNAPTQREFLDLLRDAVKRGIVVVNITQCRGGAVKQGQYETSAALLAMGVVGGADLTLEAAVCKAMWLLGKGLEGQEFARAFVQPVVGEMQPSEGSY